MLTGHATVESAVEGLKSGATDYLMKPADIEELIGKAEEAFEKRERLEEKIRAAQEMDGVEHFVSSQPQYSMIWRGPEDGVIPYSRDNGISQIVWSPLAQGVLTGKYRPGEELPEGSRATSDSMGVFMDEARDDRLLERVAELGGVADGLGISLAQLALAWVLREENVASAIIGASRPEQVEENAAASGVDLDGDTLHRIDEILGDSVSREGPAS